MIDVLTVQVTPGLWCGFMVCTCGRCPVPPVPLLLKSFGYASSRKAQQAAADVVFDQLATRMIAEARGMPQ